MKSMYLTIEFIHRRKIEETEKLLDDILLLISRFKSKDWLKIHSCIREITKLPKRIKLNIISDPTFHKFTSELNSQIITSFEKKDETILDKSLIEYVVLINISLSIFSRKLTQENLGVLPTSKSFKLPGTELLVHQDGIYGNGYSCLAIPKIDEIKVINKQIDPFFLETKIYDAKFDSEIENWLHMLGEALNLISLNHNCSLLIKYFVQYIFPLKRKTESVDFSFSSRNLPNVIFKNKETSSVLFGESLVHEGDHSFFYALETFYSFWIENSNFHEEIHFSPWRDDPRPLDGILRGLSAFTRVCMYYSTLFDKVDKELIFTIGKLLVFKINQCNIAVSTLITSNQLSISGSNLVTEMKEIIDRLDLDAKKFDHYDYWKSEATKSIEEKKINWELRNHKSN